jgi:hypothetical protein
LRVFFVSVANIPSGIFVFRSSFAVTQSTQFILKKYRKENKIRSDTLNDPHRTSIKTETVVRSVRAGKTASPSDAGDYTHLQHAQRSRFGHQHGLIVLTKPQRVIVTARSVRKTQVGRILILGSRYRSLFCDKTCFQPCRTERSGSRSLIRL